jgi:hypothetical protein
MVQYVVGCTATSNATPNTIDTWIELQAPSGLMIKIKRVRVGFGSGTQSAGIDNNFLVQFYRYTTTATVTPSTITFPSSVSASGLSAGSFFTQRSPANARASGLTTVKVKNGATGFALGTGTVQVVDQIAPNGRALYEWLARDDDDMIFTTGAAAAECFSVAITSNVASQVFSATIDWIE